jgi:hypothetical protein
MDNSIKEKIQKLLRLSKSSNPHEAALAMEKAQSLLTEHKLAMADVEAFKTPDSVVMGRAEFSNEARRVTWWKCWVLQGVCMMTSCKEIFTKGVGFSLVGTPENIALCNEMTNWIIEQIDAMASVSQLSGKDEMDSFKKGAAVTVKNRIREMVQRSKEATPKYGALMVIENQLVEKKYAEFFPIRRKMASGRATNASYNRGRAAGERVNIGRGRKLTESPSRLLG